MVVYHQGGFSNCKPITTMIFINELVLWGGFLYTTTHFMVQSYLGEAAAGMFTTGHCRINMGIVAFAGCFRSTGGFGIALIRWFYIKHPSQLSYGQHTTAFVIKSGTLSLAGVMAALWFNSSQPNNDVINFCLGIPSAQSHVLFDYNHLEPGKHITSKHFFFKKKEEKKEGQLRCTVQ